MINIRKFSNVKAVCLMSITTATILLTIAARATVMMATLSAFVAMTMTPANINTKEFIVSVNYVLGKRSGDRGRHILRSLRITLNYVIAFCAGKGNLANLAAVAGKERAAHLTVITGQPLPRKRGLA